MWTIVWVDYEEGSRSARFSDKKQLDELITDIIIWNDEDVNIIVIPPRNNSELSEMSWEEFREYMAQEVY